MAPRTRSNRAEKLEIANILASGRNVNSVGLAALPNELLLELLTQMPAPPTPRFAWTKYDADPDRHFALVSLSQTCRSLRHYFLPYAWKRIEVTDGMMCINGPLYTAEEREGTSYRQRSIMFKRHLDETIRQFETVTTRNPSLAKHVQEIDLFLPGISPAKLVERMAQALQLLPNVHTLQLFMQLDWDTSQRKPFAKYTFSQVRTLCLSLGVGDLILACPDATQILDSGLARGGRWWSYGDDIVNSRSSVAKLQVVGSFGYLTPNTISKMLEKLPFLQDISLQMYAAKSRQDDLQMLSQFKYLHTIRLVLFSSDPDMVWLLPASSKDERATIIKSLSRVLALTPVQGVNKKLVVIHEDLSVETIKITSSLNTATSSKG